MSFFFSMSDFSNSMPVFFSTESFSSCVTHFYSDHLVKSCLGTSRSACRATSLQLTQWTLLAASLWPGMKRPECGSQLAGPRRVGGCCGQMQEGVVGKEVVELMGLTGCCDFGFTLL